MKLLLVINVLLFIFGSIKIGILGLSITFIYFTYRLGIFTQIKFYRGSFPKSEIYYLEYQGMYKNVGEEFMNICKILDRFKLRENEHFSNIGIYYDNPSLIVDQTQCRAVIGILKEFNYKNYSSESEFEDYLKQKKFKKATLPDSICVTSSFTLNYMIGMFVAIKKFYGALTRNIKNEEFRRQYGISNFTFSVEICQKNFIKFIIPTKNIQDFNLTTFPKPEYKYN
jgi:hypothetical protein